MVILLSSSRRMQVPRRVQRHGLWDSLWKIEVKNVPFSNEKWWQFFGRWDSVWEISKKLLMKINCENWTIMHTLSYFILHWMHKKCSDSKRFSNKMFRFGIGCAYQCSCSLTNSHGCDPVAGKCQCNQVGSGDAFALWWWLKCWWSWSWQWW